MSTVPPAVETESILQDLGEEQALDKVHISAEMLTGEQ